LPHLPIADWVRAGGTLVFVDADRDPFLHVQEWWNTGEMHFATPREHLFKLLGLPAIPDREVNPVGKGRVIFIRRSPTEISRSTDGAKSLFDQVKRDDPKSHWKETSSFVLHRGPYVIAAGMDETGLPSRSLNGSYVNLFDPELKVTNRVELEPGARYFLIDLDKYLRSVVAAAGRVLQDRSDSHHWEGRYEGISGTPAVLLLRVPSRPLGAKIDGVPVGNETFDAAHRLVWLRFPNKATPQTIEVSF
jgi:hypothetical protein